MKKKIISIFLVFIMVISITGGGNYTDSQANESVGMIGLSIIDLLNTESDNVNEGGFYSNSDQVIDNEIPYMFVVNDRGTAKGLLEEQGICFEDTIISEGVEGQQIVGTMLNDKQLHDIEEKVIVEKNYNVNGCASETKSVNADESLWYLEAMNVFDKYDMEKKRVRVALLDSGVAYNSSLDIVKQIDLISEDSTENSSMFADSNGHGTALAGLICADTGDGKFKGISDNVDLYSVKVLDTNLQAPISRIVKGIYWAIENDMHIINMSFGTTVNSEILYEAIRAAKDAGILMIASAGNSAEEGVLYPAAYEEVIAVGATDAEGNILKTSATGNLVELYAPGTQIISTGLFEGYTSCVGTSMSAAAVTGIAARLMGNQNSSADIVRRLLLCTGKLISENVSGRLIDYGYAEENYANFVYNYYQGSIVEDDYENMQLIGSYETDGIVNGLWLNSAHEYLAEAAYGKVEGTVSSTYLTMMVYGATKSDSFRKIYLNDYAADNEYSDTSDPSNDYGGLHGQGAYTLNLKALWKYALLIGDGQSTTRALPNTMDTLTTSELELQNEGSHKGKGRTQNMLSVAGCFLKWVKANNEDYASNRTKKMYLIVGLILHMIGDIYAHRTIVPNYAFDNAKTNSYASGKKDDYASYLGKSDFANWSTLYSEYQNSKSDKTDEDKVTFVNLDKVKYVGSDVEDFNKLYEDNENFCRERLHWASKCCKEFLQKIVSTSNAPDPTVIKESEEANIELQFGDVIISYYTA